MHSQVTILVVDDHAIVREGLAACLAAETRVAICGQAGNACDARSLMERHRPALTVLDLAMPGVDGLGLLRELRSRHPAGKFVVLSMHPAAVWESRALAAGADAYVEKHATPQEMVRQILGVAGLAEKTLRPEQAARDPKRAAVGIESLSDREIEIYQLLGQGLCTREIAAKLCISPKTVDAHRENIKAKLGLTSAAGLIRDATLWAKANTLAP